MPMEWQGAPPNFQKSMDLLLHGIQGLYALCYIDDLLVFSNSFEEHVDHVVEVCARLASAGRSIRFEKAQWAQSKVKFLGFHVGHGSVTPIPSAVEQVLQIPTPKSESELRTVLGAFGVYRRFLPYFAQLVAPLFKCLSKQTGVPWSDRWTIHCDQSLTNLRVALETAFSLHCTPRLRPKRFISNVFEQVLVRVSLKLHNLPLTGAHFSFSLDASEVRIVVRQMPEGL